VAQGWESRVDFDRTLASLVDETQVVLECVPEQIALKRRILRDLSRQFPETTIIASNSPYFTPSTLAAYVESPERYAHWHFHVPLHRSSIADISGTEATEPWVLEHLQRLTEMIYQYPLRLRHEQPGYVFNWLLQSLLRSALELVANDVVDVADIDRAWKAVSGMPIGPFAMMDNIGLDVIEQVLANARWDDAPPVAIDRLLAILREPIEQGHLGVKTGRGFYEHPPK
jgi:3-hydroxybutyryl-CoA dehydrogenase